MPPSLQTDQDDTEPTCGVRSVASRREQGLRLCHFQRCTIWGYDWICFFGTTELGELGHTRRLV